MTPDMIFDSLVKTADMARQYQEFELNTDLVERYPSCKNAPRTKLEITAHVRYMCEEAMVFVGEGRLEKAGRWLGFAQGALWNIASASIDDFKRPNMPLGEDFMPS